MAEDEFPIPDDLDDLLDLTRESDDTSLGELLLSEIYPDGERPESTGSGLLHLTAQITPNPSKIFRYAGPVAVISDIHANTYALDAVLDDIEQRGINNIVSLGDVIGYGIDPLGCLDRHIDRGIHTLMGNHEALMVGIDTQESDLAYRDDSLSRTREAIMNSADTGRYMQFLSHLHKSFQVQVEDRPFNLYHASSTEPHFKGIVLPPDKRYVENPGELEMAQMDASTYLERVATPQVVGHTHIQGVIHGTNGNFFFDQVQFTTSTPFDLDSSQAIINPGSVGFPRDGDPRAAYAILYKDHVAFVRVKYDVENAATEMRATENKHLATLANRLVNGI